MPDGTQTTSERIRTAFDRSRRALTRRPSLGQGTAVTRARVRDGFACTVEDGRWTLTSDLSEKGGGTGEGPDPGVLGRSALATCLAMGYVRWAAEKGIPLESLEVEVQADYDARGEYGVGEVSPAYREIRYTVHVESPAPESEVREMIEAADRLSPWLAIIRDRQRVECTVDHSTSEA